MARVPASKQTRKQLEELFAGKGDREGDRSDLVKLAARLILEEALEGEVDDVLGRAYYAHGAQAGYRNGYRRGQLDTAEGRIDYGCPQVRATAEPFRSQIREAMGGRTEELERAGYSHRAAGRLATRLDVDLHQAVRLLQRIWTERTVTFAALKPGLLYGDGRRLAGVVLAVGAVGTAEAARDTVRVDALTARP